VSDIGFIRRSRILQQSDVQFAIATAASSYTAQGVRFDGSTYVERSAILSGGADDKQGILSVWVRMMGGDGTTQTITEGNNNGETIQVERKTSNVIQLGFGGSATYLATSTTTFTANGVWHHFLAAWDFATLTVQVYIDGVSESMTVTNVPVNSNIIWGSSANIGIADRCGGFNIANLEMADYYLNTTTYLDPSTNITKFRSVSGHPVDLGSDGSVPTGSAPSIFLHGAPVNTWQTNDGTGGGCFVIAGALTAASSNP
jgi:hypothetical protein